MHSLTATDITLSLNAGGPRLSLDIVVSLCFPGPCLVTTHMKISTFQVRTQVVSTVRGLSRTD